MASPRKAVAEHASAAGRYYQASHVLDQAPACLLDRGNAPTEDSARTSIYVVLEVLTASEKYISRRPEENK